MPMIRSALVLSILLLSVGQAHVHDWYSGYTNPSTGRSCCGAVDCKRIPASALTFLPGGYLYKELDQFMPRRNTLPSQDEDFHVCASAKELFCIFVPRIPGS